MDTLQWMPHNVTPQVAIAIHLNISITQKYMYRVLYSMVHTRVARYYCLQSTPIHPL